MLKRLNKVSQLSTHTLCYFADQCLSNLILFVIANNVLLCYHITKQTAISTAYRISHRTVSNKLHHTTDICVTMYIFIHHNTHRILGNYIFANFSTTHDANFVTKCRNVTFIWCGVNLITFGDEGIILVQRCTTFICVNVSLANLRAASPEATSKVSFTASVPVCQWVRFCYQRGVGVKVIEHDRKVSRTCRYHIYNKKH